MRQEIAADDPRQVLVRQAARAIGRAASWLVPQVRHGFAAFFDMKRALTLACYLEDTARIELAVLAAGRAERAPCLTAEQARRCATWAGMPAERMRDWLTHGDIDGPAG